MGCKLLINSGCGSNISASIEAMIGLDWSRREFMAASTAALKLGRPVRLGAIGVLGHVGEVFSQLPRLPDVQLVAVAEPDAGEFERASKNPLVAKANHYSSYRKMLDAEKLDVVSVCNSNGDRAKAIVAAAEHRLPMIAEKPLAISRDDYEHAKKAILKSGQPIALLLPMRYEQHYKAIRRIVESGALGDIGMISAQKSYKAGDRPKWMQERASYGSTILWIGIHMFDLMRWTSGHEFTEAFSYQAQVAAPESIGVMENTTSTVLRMDNGGTASLHMDYYRCESALTHGDDRLRLAGSKGVAEYMAATGVTLLQEGKKPRVITELPEAGSVFVDFLESTFGDKASTMPLNDVWKVNEITIAANEAAIAHRPVKI